MILILKKRILNKNTNIKKEYYLSSKILIKENILLLIKTKCYRGVRLKNKLPCRGQRTRTNAINAKKFVY